MVTTYNEKENRFELVEEPDPSLSYTYADYLKWKFEEQVELIHGQIFRMSPAPDTRHQEISGRVFLRLASFLEKEPCKVFSAPFDVRLPLQNRQKDSEITTVVQPDISVVCDLAKLDEKGCVGAPDLVSEILSKGNTNKEVRLKYELYENAGVREYWMIYPAEQNLAVFTLNEKGRYEGARIYASGEQVESTAITQFIIHIDDIFTS